ncbi:MAG: rane protein, partial [Verrucomicrobia bacterium]|nr:rane protein [Verrucomicrobiota bacterium]
KLMERHGSLALFIGRFLPGLRAPIFFTAGSMKVSFLKFIFFDGIAAVFSVPAFVWLGHWLWMEFSEDLEQLNETLERTHSYSLWVALFVVSAAVVAGWMWSRRTRVST